MTDGRPNTAKRTAPVVAIDGPAGAGKSTVSRQVAEKLGYTLLDTGALYRCVGLRAGELGVMRDREAVIEVARELARTNAVRFTSAPGAEQLVWLGDRNVTLAIRSPEVSQYASQVSPIPEVREALLELQRSVGREGRVVVEGRDIGTVVFPDAELKFFLTASVEQRATRRYLELSSRKEGVSLSQVTQEVEERDRRDSGRPVAPLLQADDAELIDSTALGIEQVVAHIVLRVKACEAAMAAQG
ncbi:MAG TPA: (d)CMP kinase [Polyangiaceae bacterium]|jgi:cytidylate kinase|nr:(d)CMP kinase [Polyangiaceae bacterium]